MRVFFRGKMYAEIQGKRHLFIRIFISYVYIKSFSVPVIFKIKDVQ